MSNGKMNLNDDQHNNQSNHMHTNKTKIWKGPSKRWAAPDLNEMLQDYNEYLWQRDERENVRLTVAPKCRINSRMR
jgi:hypothetical protein